MPKVHVSFPDPLYERLQARAAQEAHGIGEVVRAAVAAYLRESPRWAGEMLVTEGLCIPPEELTKLPVLQLNAGYPAGSGYRIDAPAEKYVVTAAPEE